MKITYGKPVQFGSLEIGDAFIYTKDDHEVYKKVMPFGPGAIQKWNVVGFVNRVKPWDVLTDEDLVYPIIEAMR